MRYATTWPMAEKFASLLDTLRQRRALRHWTRAAAVARDLPPSDLRAMATHARALQGQLNALTHEADARLRGPRIGRDVIDMPAQCDWAWRPDAWRGPIYPATQVGTQSGTEVGAGLKLFHDCPLAELILRQHRNFGPGTAAPFSIALDVLGFEGSFLSLVVDLPDAGRTSMNRTHIFRVTGRLEVEHEIACYARLNVKHGPNTEQLVSKLEPKEGAFAAEFDLGHAEVNEKRLETVWMDIIFEQPAMNRIVLGDLTLMRRPRADI